MKRILFILILLLGLTGTAQAGFWDFLFGSNNTGAPTSEVYQKTLLPITTSTYNIGSDTKVWLAGFFDTATTTTLCFTDNTCQTTAGGSQTPWTSNIDGGGYNITNVGNASTTQLSVSGNTWLSNLTAGSIPFIGANGLISQNNSGLFYDSSNGGTLALGDNSGMLNVFQAVKAESTSVVANVKALISSRNTNTTNDNWAGFTMQTEDTTGDVFSGARIMTQFTSHADDAVSADMVFDTRNAGARAEKMRILANGSVGIGTTSPSTKLEVDGDITADNFLGNWNGSSSFVPYTGATTDIDLGANNFKVNTDSLFVDSTTGRVGIGTTEPGAKLTIKDDTRNALSDVGTPSNYHTHLWGAATDNTGIGIAFGSQTNVGSAIISKDVGAQQISELQFYTKTSTNGGADPIQKMVIDTTGNIGIGTTDPDTLLHINSTTATSTAYLESTGAGFGGRVIMEREGGSLCSETWAGSDGLLYTELVSCP